MWREGSKMMSRVANTSIFILIACIFLVLSCNNNPYNKGSEEGVSVSTNNEKKTGNVKINYKIGSSKKQNCCCGFFGADKNMDCNSIEGWL